MQEGEEGQEQLGSQTLQNGLGLGLEWTWIGIRMDVDWD